MKSYGLISKIFILCALAFFVFTGCSKKAVAPDTLEANAMAGRPDPISELNQKLFADANVSQDRSDYLLGPGDLLEMKVFQAENLNTTIRISSRGLISLPLLGEVDLTGKTAFEAETLIEEKYKEKYIKDPHVSIFVKEHYSQRVTIVGQVKNPGTYDYPSKQCLLDILALAGGLTEKAGQVIQVRKLGGDSDTLPQTYLIDLDQLINEGKTELNIGINGGDVIFVPETGYFFVDGAVRRPGQYYINDKLNLNEALINAGGLLSFANKKEVILLRKSEDGRREELKFNLENKTDTPNNEMIVKDGDIIFVDASFWGKFFSGSGLNIGIPGMGVSYRDPQR